MAAIRIDCSSVEIFIKVKVCQTLNSVEFGEGFYSLNTAFQFKIRLEILLNLSFRGVS